MGAFDGNTMVAMSVATPMRETGLLWSHMAGVLPEYQGQGIGYQIKQVQKQWAIENGYTEIHWSFDPAMRRNANFNFRQLGVITNQYHANFYGKMSDGINAGVPSDRFEAIWKLTQATQSYDMLDDIKFALSEIRGKLVIDFAPTEDYLAVACPYDFPAIKAKNLEQAVYWRECMRGVFMQAFSLGYEVVDFVTNHESKSCFYVLYRIES